tara:strand:+ start:185 stop:535 length:351 start_codon:yes stop_codon:yes gene_type:complete
MYYDNPPLALSNFFSQIKLFIKDFDELYFMCQDYKKDNKSKLDNYINNYNEIMKKVFYDNLDKLDVLDELYNNNKISKQTVNEIKSDYSDVINNLDYDSGKFSLIHIMDTIVDTYV